MAHDPLTSEHLDAIESRANAEEGRRKFAALFEIHRQVASERDAAIADAAATRSALRQLLAVAEVHHQGGFTNCVACGIVREARRVLVSDVSTQETTR